MPCLVNLNTAPALLEADLTALVPVGASCVTLTFRLCANAAAAPSNQVEIRIFWSAAGGVPLSQQTSLQATATCGELDTCLQVVNSPAVSPPNCVVWDLTLPVPAGKNDVQLTATEVGDPANPGTLEVWVAFA